MAKMGLMLVTLHLSVLPYCGFQYMMLKDAFSYAGHWEEEEAAATVAAVVRLLVSRRLFYRIFLVPLLFPYLIVIATVAALVVNDVIAELYWLAQKYLFQLWST